MMPTMTNRDLMTFEESLLDHANACITGAIQLLCTQTRQTDQRVDAAKITKAAQGWCKHLRQD
jgi:hypothetical protein